MPVRNMPEMRQEKREMTTEEDYPTEEDLAYIKNYDLMKRPVKALVEYIQDIWWAPDWGFILRDEQDDYESIIKIDGPAERRWQKVLELHTGGWSGNEDIIRTLEANEWFWMFYWFSSRVGGHYEFHIRKEDWDKDEILLQGQ
jgi:hypothetical protein